MKTVSFREVHQSLENESLFLTKEHDFKNFKDKGDFLESCGFSNSIATRLYKGIIKSEGDINILKRQYPTTKFIILPQLERVLEKYNLYQRNPEYFMGDIPEKNIKDMQNFNVYFRYLRNTDKEILDFTYQFLKKINRTLPNRIPESEAQNHTKFLELDWLINDNKSLKLNSFINLLKTCHNYYVNNKISSVTETSIEFNNPLQISAVKELFNDLAWEKGNSRILNRNEIEAKSQVDLDPIINFEFEKAIAIVTAWGDESNDELVFNEQNN